MPIRQAGSVTRQKKSSRAQIESRRDNETSDSQIAGTKRALRLCRGRQSPPLLLSFSLAFYRCWIRVSTECWCRPNHATANFLLPSWMTWCFFMPAARWSIGPVRFVFVLGIVTFWSLITVSNKVNLQNQLQNPYARNSKESNECFDRVIRGWLL